MAENEADDTFAERCLRGDAEAFGVLVDRYQGPIFAAILHMVENYEDARELTQQVFLKSWQHLSSYDPSRKFFSWLYRIAINESINHVRGRRNFESLDQENAHVPSVTPFEALETSRSVREAMRGLKPEYQEVIALRHFMGCSYEDAAEILQLPVKTVKSRLFSARQLLREALAPRGGKPEAR